MRRFLIAPLAIMAVTGPLTSPAQAAAPITGRYLTEGGRSVVLIDKCGATLCGKVVKVNVVKPGSPSFEGTTILSGLVDAGPTWAGKILNPADGKSYNAKLSLNPNRSLKIEVCVSFICKGLNWTSVN